MLAKPINRRIKCRSKLEQTTPFHINWCSICNMLSINYILHIIVHIELVQILYHVKQTWPQWDPQSRVVIWFTQQTRHVFSRIALLIRPRNKALMTLVCSKVRLASPLLLGGPVIDFFYSCLTFSTFDLCICTIVLWIVTLLYS